MGSSSPPFWWHIGSDPTHWGQSTSPSCRRPYGVLSMRELEQECQRQPPRYIVEGLIPIQSVNIAVGDSGLGKSPCAYQMAMCVATGRPFLGVPVRQGRALYIDQENGLADMLDLCQCLSRHIGIEELPDGMFFLPHIAPGSSLEGVVMEYRPSLVVIDSLRTFRPDAEQKNQFAALLINELRYIAKKYDAAFLLIHHVKKPGQDGVPSLADTPVMTWLLQACGARALVNQTDVRMGFDITASTQQSAATLRAGDPAGGTVSSVALVVKGFQRLRGEFWPWYLARALDEDGEPLGYRRLTGVALLFNDDQARDRHQTGWVEETGKQVKRWKGHYYVYLKQPDGTERRRHRAVILGPKAGLRKWEAQRELQRVIERETGGKGLAKPDGKATFGWFWEHRYLPLKAAKWRRSTRDAILYAMNAHVLPRIGERALCELMRFELQAMLNELAGKYSRSVLHKVKTWVKAVLEEAVEQEYLDKNSVRKLEMPTTRPTCKRYLRQDEVGRLLSVLRGRDRLIARLLLLCALRPGELFALRRHCVEPGRLRIERAVYRGEVGETKTEDSNAYVALPPSLEAELWAWIRQQGIAEDGYIFCTQRGTPIDTHNYLQRVLQPAARQAGIAGLTFQALRRTFATHVQGLGTVKDAQAQMRHAAASTTLNVYAQSIPETVAAAVEALAANSAGF